MIKVNLNALVIFLAFLPYSPNLIPFTDLEPFCFLICFLTILVNFDRINLKLIDITWMTALCFSVFSSLMIIETMTDFRTLFGGVSFLIFFIYGYVFLPKVRYGLILKIIRYFWILWLLGLILQSLGVSTYIMAADRTTSGRGFTSFAPEATFAALQVMSITALLIILNQRFREEKMFPKKYLFLGYVFPIFVHISATALACYLGALFSRVLVYSVKNIIFLSVMLILITWIALSYSILSFNADENRTALALMFDKSDLRIISIWEYVITGRILEDASAFDRLSSSFFFLFSPYYFPQVINHSIWISDLNNFIQSLNSSNQVNYSYRNLSGLGQLNVLTGLLFIIPLRGVLKACIVLPFSGRGFYILVPGFILVLFFSTPLAHPLFGIILGSAAYVFSNPYKEEFVNG